MALFLSRSRTSLLPKAPSLNSATPFIRSVITWHTQDDWNDPNGPPGYDRPSPKLAELVPGSPRWLYDLHKNGVSHISNGIESKMSNTNKFETVGSC